MKRFFKAILVFAVTVLSVAAVFSVSPKVSAAASNENWITAWGTAPAQVKVNGLGAIGSLVGDVTVRSVITPTADGTRLRIKISNYYGQKPLKINYVTVAKSKGDSKIDLATLKNLSFNDGYPGVTVLAGTECYSDPISFNVNAHEDLAITIYASEYQDVSTMGLSGADTYITTGDAGKTEDFDLLKTVIDDQEMLDILTKVMEGFGMGSSVNLKLAYNFVKVVPFVSSVEVLSNDAGYSVVVAGDSTVANEFPLYLAQALYEDENITNVGVSGKGIIGNSLLSGGLGVGDVIYAESMLSRLKRDVLSQPNVKYAILKIGVKDIIHPVCTDSLGSHQPSANEIIEGFRTVFEECHKVGVKVVVIGITQWKGTTRDYFGDGGTYIRTSAEFQQDWQIAKDVNEWLAATNEHDGYVDFCDISENPLDPDALLPEYSEDCIHPTPALQRLWSNYFPLSLIGVGGMPGGVYIDENDGVVYVGEETQITATVYPETAENKAVEWYSENPEIATVDVNGMVRGVSNGTAVIGCKTVVGGYKATCRVTVKTAPQSIILSYGANSIYTSESFQLKATVFPETTTDKTVVWSSEDKDVATVSSDGKVTGVGRGTTVINCKTPDGSISASCTVTVKKKTHVQNIELSFGDETNYTKHTLYKGQSFKLSAEVSPMEATFKNIKWSSTNEKVVTVDSQGRVTAVGGGKASVRCTSVDNPMVSAACTVTVKVKATGITLSSTAVKLYEGKTKTLSAKIYPADATNTSVKWKSQNSKVAKVSSGGKITAVNPGTTYITGTTANGKYTAKCKVTVLEIVYSKKITLSKTSLTLSDGKSTVLTEKISPSDTTNKTVMWSSSNTKIVKVSSNGKVTAIKPGTAYIYCKVLDSGKTAKCKVTVKKVTPSSVKLSAESTSIAYGKTKTLKATVSPSNSTDKTLKWTSSDPSVVYVSQSGKIKGLKAGKSAVITVTTNSGKRTDKITVKVTHVEPDGLRLNKTSVAVSKGGTVTVTPTFLPSNTTIKTVKWTSSNKKVATVSSKGVIKGVSDGTAIITCETENGITATCLVTVAVVPVRGVTIEESGGLIMHRGSSYTLKANVYPATATNKKLTWVSSNTSVATVSSSGKVTAKKAGSCEIKVTTADGGYTASCIIVVN